MPGGDDGLIPTVEPQVEPSADLPMAATPQALGADIGQAVENFGMTANRIGYNQRVRDLQIAQIAAQDGAQAVALDDQKGLHGENGLMFQEAGIGAPKASEDYLSQRDEKVSQVRNSLPTDAARRSFDLHERQQRSRVEDQLASWQHAQVNAADAKALKASSELHLNEAIIGASETDPVKRNETINTGLAKGSMNIIDYAERHNWTKDETDVALKGYSSEIVTSVVKSLADSGDHHAAAAFFEDHKADVTGEGMIQAQAILKVSSRQNKSRDIADKILNDGGTLSEQRNLALELTKNEDADVRDQVIGRVFQADREIRAAHAQEQIDILNQGFAAMDQDPDHHMPASLYESADPAGKRQMLSYQASLRTHGAIITDDAAYNELTALSSSGNPAVVDRYLDLNLQATYADKLAPEALRKEIDTQARIRKERNENIISAQTVNAQIETRVLNETLPLLGITPQELKPDGKRYDDAEAKKVTLLRDRFRQAVLAEQKGDERPLQFEEAKKIAARLIADEVIPASPGFLERWSIPSPLTIPRAIFGGKAEPETQTVPSFMTPDAALTVYSVHEIPEIELEKVRKANAKAGAGTDDDALIRTYNRAKIKAAHVSR